MTIWQYISPITEAICNSKVTGLNAHNCRILVILILPLVLCISAQLHMYVINEMLEVTECSGFPDVASDTCVKML